MGQPPASCFEVISLTYVDHVGIRKVPGDEHDPYDPTTDTALRKSMRARALFGVIVIPTVTYYGSAGNPWRGPRTFFGSGRTSVPFVDLGLRRPRSIWRTLALGMAVGVALALLNRLLLTPLIERGNTQNDVVDLGDLEADHGDVEGQFFG